MTLKNVEEIISTLEGEKFKNTDIKSEMFNLGIEKAIEIITNAPVVDAKVKVDKKVYHQNYYHTVTKLKRQREREERARNNQNNSQPATPIHNTGEDLGI